MPCNRNSARKFTFLTNKILLKIKKHFKNLPYFKYYFKQPYEFR